MPRPYVELESFFLNGPFEQFLKSDIQTLPNIFATVIPDCEQITYTVSTHVFQKLRYQVTDTVQSHLRDLGNFWDTGLNHLLEKSLQILSEDFRNQYIKLYHKVS